MAETRKSYEALTHLSVHRDRAAGETPGLVGADFVGRGEEVKLDEERAKTLLALGAVRPWSERGTAIPPRTARDMSGRMFPDQAVQVAGAPMPARPSGEANPESTDPQPGEGGAPSAVDPYATGA